MYPFRKYMCTKNIVDEFSKRLVELAEKLVVGDPADEKTEVGPLIQEKEVDRVDEWVQEAKNGGAKNINGRKKKSAPPVTLPLLFSILQIKRMYQPVKFLGRSSAYILFKDRLEAIDRANSTPFSFQAAVITRNLDTALDTAKRINATTVMINDHTAFRVDWMPFGGRKASGIGVGGILPSMIEMTEEKNAGIPVKINLNPTSGFFIPRGLPRILNKDRCRIPRPLATESFIQNPN